MSLSRGRVLLVACLTLGCVAALGRPVPWALRQRDVASVRSSVTAASAHAALPSAVSSSDALARVGSAARSVSVTVVSMEVTGPSQVDLDVASGSAHLERLAVQASVSGSSASVVSLVRALSSQPGVSVSEVSLTPSGGSLTVVFWSAVR